MHTILNFVVVLLVCCLFAAFFFFFFFCKFFFFIIIVVAVGWIRVCFRIVASMLLLRLLVFSL